MSAAETATEQAAIEALLDEHEVALHGWGTDICCNCGEMSDSYPEHRAHVAAVIAQQRAADTGDRETLAEALADLVALKDGPRDEDYARRKPLAWDAARAALAGEPRRDDGQGVGA